MKTLMFILGLLLGLWIADAALLGVSDAARPAAVLNAPGGGGGSESRRERMPANPTAPENQPRPDAVPPAQPARAHPFAFLFSIHPGYDTSRLSAEERADPQFRELLDRAVRAMARDRMAPIAFALGLNDAQFAALLDVNCEQAEAWRGADAQPVNAPAREVLRVQLSRAAEARLATVLSPEQMERLAGLKFGGQSVLWTVDAYASRGLPVPRERLPELIAVHAVQTPRGRFLQAHEPPLDPGLAWLNEPQRRRASQLQRWLAASELVDAARSVRVKDPALRDMWPQD